MTEQAKLSRRQKIAAKNQPPGVTHPSSIEQVAALEKMARDLVQRSASGEKIPMSEISALLDRGEACNMTCRAGIKCLPYEESIFVRLESTFPREMKVAPGRADILINHVLAATDAFRAAAAGKPFASRREVYARAYASNLMPESFKPLI